MTLEEFEYRFVDFRTDGNIGYIVAVFVFLILALVIAYVNL